MGLVAQSDFLLVMNPDVILCPRFFSPMIQTLLDETKSAGIAFLNFLGEHTVISRDVEKAKEYFDKSLEAPMCVYCKSDTCHEVYLRLALHYYFMGEKEKVAEAFEIVRNTKPFDIDLLGSIYLIEKDLI